VLSGVVIAAAVAAVTERGILGAHPVIEAPSGLALGHPGSLILYAVLGLAAALASVVFIRCLLGVRAWFRRNRALPAWAKPALGGLLTGALALLALLVFRQEGVAGGGYGALSGILGGDLPLRVLAGLLILKLAATVASYSSGGVGGIFMPVLFLGALLGGLVGHLDLVLIPAPQSQVSAFALVGMGALFAGVVRAPITSVLIIFEMTDGYGLILPLMIANMITYGLMSRWNVKPVYEALLEQDGVRLPAPRRAGTILERIEVGEAMQRDPRVLAAEDSVGRSLEVTLDSGQAVYPIVDGDGRYGGVVHDAELRQRAAEGRLEAAISEFRDEVPPLGADEPLRRAVERMHRERRHVLPVVQDAGGAGRVVGLLTMGDIVRAQGEHLARSDDADVS
jgi:CIC family chloride channel protein